MSEMERSSAEEECNSGKQRSMDKPQRQANEICQTRKMLASLTRLPLDAGLGQANSEGAGRMEAMRDWGTQEVQMLLNECRTSLGIIDG